MDLLRCLLLACLVGASEQWSYTNETTLRSTLLTNYNNLVRPSETTDVYIYFQMCSIDSIDIKAQVFKTSGWWYMQWNDTRLSWDPASNDNIPVLQFYEDLIWKPAIVVSNSYISLSAIDEDTIPARVNSEGVVTWQPPAILGMSCEMDSTYFPFDRQTCSIVLTSFGYTLNEVSILTDEGVRMDFYTENGDWEIKGMSKVRSIYYEGGFPYSMVTLSVEAKRRSTFHWINIIIPILINSLLCSFVFLLPADSGEKMGYSLTCLLAFVVLLTLLAADMPTSAKHTSLLEVYITIALGMSALTVVFSQLVLHFHFRDNELHPVKGRCLRMTKFAMFLLRDKRLKKTDPKVHPAYSDNSGRPPSYESEERPTKTPVRRLSATGSTDDDDDVKITWQIVAEVMDGVCLRFYTSFITLLTFIFLLTMALGQA